MNVRKFVFIALLGSATFTGQSQGTFIFDQQSSTESTLLEGGGKIQSLSPVGQSFTPTLDSVGFVRLYLEDGNYGNSLGAVIYVNLRADSINGPVLGTTDLIALPDFFAGFPNLFFSAPVAVNPGTTYYLQPVVQSGDPWIIDASILYHYPGGTAIFNGTADPTSDLWFREGIVTPEPSTWALLLIFGGTLFFRRCKG